MVTDVLARRRHRAAPALAAGAVLDPEVPVLTIADLGVLRDVTVDAAGRGRRQLTPTYSGCPAMDVIRRDVERAVRAAGFAEVEVRTVLVPGLDDRLDDRRGRASTGRATASRRRSAARSSERARSSSRCRSAARSAAAPTPGAVPVRLDRMQVAGALQLPAASRSTTSRRSDVTTTADRRAPPRRVPPAAGGRGRAAHRRRRRPHVRGARRAARRVPFTRRAAPHRAHRDRRRRGAAQLLDLLAARRPAAALRVGGEAARGRGVLRLRHEALQVGDELDVMTPAGTFCSRLDPAPGQALRAPSRPAAASRRCCRSSPRVLDASREQPVTLVYGDRTTPVGDVPRGARRPQGPLPRRGSSWCTCSPGSRRTSGCCPGGSTRRGCAGCCGAAAGGQRRRVVPVRAVRDGRAGAAQALRGGCRRPRTCTTRCSTSRASAAAAARRAERGARRRQQPVTARLDGRGVDVRRARGRAVASWTRCCACAADAPYACKGGVCGTCRALVVGRGARWTATSRWSRRRSRRGSCWPASRIRSPRRWCSDFDQ